jgi:hypothetical protein
MDKEEGSWPRDQYETLKPVVTVIKLGPAGNRYPGRIGLSIESIRRVE